MASNKKPAAPKAGPAQPAAPAETVAQAAPAVEVVKTDAQPKAPAVKGQVHEQIGALLYYEDPKWTDGVAGDMIHFEQLAADEQKVWFERGLQCVNAIDKLNLVVATKGEVKEQKITLTVEKEQARKVIAGFVKTLNTTRPELFPIDELVARLYPG